MIVTQRYLHPPSSLEGAVGPRAVTGQQDGLWAYSRVKMGELQIVPLARPVAAIFRELHALHRQRAVRLSVAPPPRSTDV